jgi:thioredoxin-related protein
MKFLSSIFLIFVLTTNFSCKTKTGSPVEKNSTEETTVNTGDIPVTPAMHDTTSVASTAGSTSSGTSASPKIHSKNGKIDWYEIQSTLDYNNPEGKMFFIDVYTEWCGWCKVMDKKTFSDPKVQKVMNEKFHMVKFDAEQKEAINFNNRKFEWANMGRSGINMLAVELLGEQMGFPSYVILDKNKKPLKVTAGFMEADKFLQEIASIK